ncbi:hypothetical protein FBY31_1222 [Arthrobacter sp. SLBN-100]|uniref:hypothetical protein n=1 Tax=Arthrobacter sp. SLBN-100 TaxID=2768450 RepID=UPI00115005E6|nr:hypothetical protein [Arthrobacter sp. SLBN-100]TQJ67161.1 hypothetical protein FBY31_1222 [Arthrobacter sp. SLBN-100]
MSKSSKELEDQGLNRDEAEAVAVPEIGVSGLTTGGGAERISQGFLHTVHPDTGNDVVFVPGEALPDWAVKVQNEAQAQRLNSTAGSASDVAANGKRAVSATLSEQEPPKDRR